MQFLFRSEIYVYRASNGEVIASVDAKSSRIQDILFLNESVICYSSTFGVLNVWNYVDESMSLKLSAGVKDRIRSILKLTMKPSFRSLRMDWCMFGTSLNGT